MAEPYLNDPDAIYRQSFSIIDEEADFSALPDNLHPVVRRIVHACGMVDVAAAIRFAGDVAGNARRSIERGGIILCDVEMVRHGIIERRLPPATRTVCTLSETRATKDRTRSAAAVERWRPMLGGAVCVIGNAPTALFRLLELIDDGAEPPAAIFAFPVGFVGAVESKQALIDHAGGVPYLTLPGRRGGSAMAAAAINGLFND